MHNNIQALRAVAAILVVLFHSCNLYLKLGSPILFFASVAFKGNIGVDIFFVISGFVIAHTTSPRVSIDVASILLPS
jgi:exopolysaccharide production protein ExoZ